MLSSLSPDELREIFKAMANPLDPQTVFASSATCRTIRDAMTEAPHGGESELGKLCRQSLRVRRLCRNAGRSCGQVLVAEELEWQRKRLTDDDALAVATLVLPFTAVLTNLNIGINQIGPTGATALADALKVNAVLTNLNLRSNEIGDAGAVALGKVLKVNAVLKRLGLGLNGIGPTGASALADALKVNAVMTTLNITGNQIGDVGATAIGEALKVKAVLTILDLSNNKIGPTGATALGDALKVNAVLNGLDLSYNRLGDAGKQALLAAKEQRSGSLELYL